MIRGFFSPPLLHSEQVKRSQTNAGKRAISTFIWILFISVAGVLFGPPTAASYFLWAASFVTLLSLSLSLGLNFISQGMWDTRLPFSFPRCKNKKKKKKEKKKRNKRLKAQGQNSGRLTINLARYILHSLSLNTCFFFLSSAASLHSTTFNTLGYQGQ